MTDRIHALTVTLDQDHREDDVQSIVDAIRMIRGVVDVAMHVTDIGTHAARAMAKQDLRAKLFDVLR